MNKEDTKKAIEVMQAYVDGETIVNDEGRRLSVESIAVPVWDWYHNNYSIRPEPVERWIAVWKQGGTSTIAYNSKRNCLVDCNGNSDFIKAIKLVEAQDEN